MEDPAKNEKKSNLTDNLLTGLFSQLYLLNYNTQVLIRIYIDN